MDRVLTDKIVLARKHYKCDACEEWNRAGYTLRDCATNEQRLIVQAAEADRWRILPGQRYRKVVGIFERDLCTYRARPGMDTVCRELGLWYD